MVTRSFTLNPSAKMKSVEDSPFYIGGDVAMEVDRKWKAVK